MNGIFVYMLLDELVAIETWAEDELSSRRHDEAQGRFDADPDGQRLLEELLRKVKEARFSVG